MSKHIEQTEIKRPVSRKHKPKDHTENERTMTFTDELMIKRYPINPFVKQFSFGKVCLMDKDERVPFRVFQESELNIPLIFQNRLNQMVCDDDVQTTASQIDHAKQQNQKDIVREIYEKERPIDRDDAGSLFASQQFSTTSNYQNSSFSSKSQ